MGNLFDVIDLKVVTLFNDQFEFWSSYFARFFADKETLDPKGMTGQENWWKNYPANIYLFKVSNKNTRKMYAISSKLTMKIPERRRWRRWTYFTPFLVFLLLTL